MITSGVQVWFYLDNRQRTLDSPIDKVMLSLTTFADELERLVEAIAAGGEVSGLLEALKTRDAQRQELAARRDALRTATRGRQVDVGRVRRELLELAAECRQVLADDPAQARPIVTELLDGRVVFTPLEQPKCWHLGGRGTVLGLFKRDVFPSVWHGVPSGPARKQVGEFTSTSAHHAACSVTSVNQPEPPWVHGGADRRCCLRASGRGRSSRASIGSV